MVKEPAVTVSVRDVVNEMNLPNEEWAVYLNRRTGEFVLVTDEDADAVEREEEGDDLPDWQRESLPRIHEATQSSHFVVLPTPFDIHEWAIMRRFCGSVEPLRLREELLEAIHGRGAFRMFRAAVHRHEIQDDWYAFRDAELQRIAIDWLEDNEIPYVLEEAR